MAKKILKRSLALGALMAFVITGSAMAEEVLSSKNHSENNVLLSDGKSYVLDSTGPVTITSSTENTIANNATITVGDNQVLNLISTARGRDYNGILNTNVTINGNGNVTIHQKDIIGNAICSMSGYSDIVKITANKINVTADSGCAIYAEAGDKVDLIAKEILLSGSFASDSESTAGVYAAGGSEVSITGFDKLNISVKNNSEVKGEGGPAINNVGSKVTISGGEATLSSEGRAAVAALSGSTTSITARSLSIATKNLAGDSEEARKSSAVAAKDGSTLEINVSDKLYITNNDPNGTTAINAQGNSKIDIKGTANIDINGNVYGESLATEANSKIGIEGNDVTITSNAGQGSDADTAGVIENTSIIAQGKVVLTATGNQAGIGVRSNAGHNAENSIRAKEIEINSAKSFGVYANDFGWDTVGTVNHITLDAEKITINSEKDGIQSMNGAVINIKNFDELNIKSNEQGINSEYGELSITGKNIDVDAAEQGIRSLLGGNIELNTESTVIKADSEAIKATGRSSVEINSTTTQLTGDIVLSKHDGEALEPNVKVNFGDSRSFLKGKVTTSENGRTELTFSNSASWDVTGDSNVSKLKADGGIVNLGKTPVTVDVEEANGSDLKVNTDSTDNKLQIGQNDVKKITVAAGENLAAGITDANQGEQLQSLADVVDVAEGNKQKTVTVAAGDVSGAITAVTDGNGKIATVQEEANTTNAAVSDMASISMMTWRQENNDMNKRLGELRDSKGQYGAWARMARGESKYGAQGVKNQYNYYQIGYDEKLSTDPHWTVGVALTRTEGNSTFKDGSGENNHTGVAVYGSYLGENGSFIDLIAKYSRMDNEYKTTAGVGDADYKTNGYSVSAEYGKRFTKDNGLWIEPQVELTYGTVGSANYMTSKDASVRQDGIDSLVGRVGFALGKNIKAGNVYARASYLYDFDGEANVTYSKGGVTRSFEQDLGGGWWEVGIGSNINLSNATHLYFDVEKTYGGDVATPWQWNVGVRYSF